VLSTRAFVALGELTPADVDVQLVHGVINSEDDLVDTRIEPLRLAESYEGGRHRFDGDLVLDHSGAFGYTVRVVPHNDLLTSPAELGVVALP
jgi:starch phosphorylase